MKTVFRTLLAVSVALVTATSASAAHAAGEGIDSWLLYDHKRSVSLGETVTMWECWGDMDGSDPRLLQRVGKKWKTLDISTVTRDVDFCGKKEPLKAVYTFKVRDALRWNKKEKSYEAVVKTVCSTCQTYNWTILVDK